MRALKDFSIVDHVPVGDRGFDFATPLANGPPGDTIATATVTVRVVTGIDNDAQAILIGSPTILGTVVFQTIGTPLAWVTYNLICVVTTQVGKTYMLNAHLPCAGIT